MFSIERALCPIEPPPPLDRNRLLLKGGAIISMDETIGDLEQADLLIEGSNISAIGPSLSSAGAEVIDARDMIITPGFVDCHRHSWQAQLRHLNPNSASVMHYCRATHFSFASHYRPLDIYVGTLLTAISGIDAGITTFIDNAHNSRTDDHAIASVEAWLDAGVRAIHAPGPPLTGAWDEEDWPRKRLAGLADRLGREASDLVTLGVMSQFDPDVWALARELHIPIITEVGDPAMADLIRQFDQRGLLGPDNIFNHVTGLPHDVLALLRNAGVGVNVCPRSDAQYGIADGGMGAFQAALDAGLRPALSVDNETSYSGDMFGEMRTEFFMQRAMTQRDRFAGKQDVPAPLTVRQMLEAATVDGARCACLHHRIGALTPGREADLIAFRVSDLNLHPLNNALGAVVHGADRGNIDTVIIGGRARKRAGKIVGLDEDKLRMIVKTSRDYLLEAHGYRPGLFSERHDALAGKVRISRYWH